MVLLVGVGLAMFEIEVENWFVEIEGWAKALL